MHVNEITRDIISAGISVHRALGPGLLESAYQKCMYQELTARGVAFEREVPIPLEYRGIRLDCGYRLDLLVARRVVVEVKAIEAIAPIHEAQLITYLRLGWASYELQCCGIEGRHQKKSARFEGMILCAFSAFSASRR